MYWYLIAVHRLCSQDPDEDKRLEAKYYAENQRVAKLLEEKGFGIAGDEPGGVKINRALRLETLRDLDTCRISRRTSETGDNMAKRTELKTWRLDDVEEALEAAKSRIDKSELGNAKKEIERAKKRIGEVRKSLQQILSSSIEV